MVQNKTVQRTAIQKLEFHLREDEISTNYRLVQLEDDIQTDDQLLG